MPDPMPDDAEPSLDRQTVVRSPDGRFAAGTAPGPGRTDLADRGRYLRAVKAAVTHDDLVDVLKAMVTKGKRGSEAASKLVLEYTVGRPAVAVIVGDADGPAFKTLIGIDEGAM